MSKLLLSFALSLAFLLTLCVAEVRAQAGTSGSAITYYVDAVSGSDLNNGTSKTTALRTVAKVNTLSLTPGSTVAFKAGQVWHETLKITRSGTNGSPITYSSYDTGAQPVITAADTVRGWSQGNGATSAENCTSPAFCSGFENTSFADWEGAVGENDATATIANAPVGHGKGALALSTSNGVDTRAYVKKSIPAFYPGVQYAFRFYVFTPKGSLKPNNSFRVLEMLNGANSVGFASIYTDAVGNVRSLSFYDTADNSNLVAETPLSGFTMGAWNEIELDVTPSSTAGGGTLYLNGVQQGAVLKNSPTRSWIGVNKILFGNTAYGSAIAAGKTIYFDDFKTAASAQPIGFANMGLPKNIWTRTQATDPKLINFAGKVGAPVADPSLLSAQNQFAWSKPLLYVYSTVDPTATAEVPARESAVTSSGASYVTFTGLEFRGGQTYNVFCGQSTTPCDHWDFEGDTFNAGYSNELYMQPYPGTIPAALTVRNCTFKGGGSNGIALSGPGATGATIVNNTFYDLSKIYNTAYSQNTWSDAIEGYSADGRDGAGTYVGYNNIHDIGAGVGADYGGGIHPDTVTGWTIEHNIVQNTNSAGIQLEKGTRLAARYNLIVNGGTRLYSAGLMLRAGDGVSVDSAIAENNTAYGGWWSCSMLVQQNAGTVTLRNTSFRKNICYASRSGTQLYADAGTNDGSNSIATNAFGFAQPYFLVFANTALSNLADLNSMLGYTTDNVQGDPLFTNVAAGVFTLQAATPARGLGAFPNP